MSLDVYLEVAEPCEAKSRQVVFIRRNGRNEEITREEWDHLFPGREPVTVTVDTEAGEVTTVFTANITHNLTLMANEAEVYQHIWHPDDIGITRAHQLIDPLTAGLGRLQTEPGRFMSFNPPNGWGNYESLVAFVEAYLVAARQYPEAHVRASP